MVFVGSRGVLGKWLQPISQVFSSTAGHHLLPCGRKTANMVKEGCQWFFSRDTVALGASRFHPAVAYHVNVYIFWTRMGPEKLSPGHAGEDNFLGLKLGHIHADLRSWLRVADV